jgi:hypothetical protein
MGVIIGTALGVMNLIDTARHPLADDDPGAMLVWAVALLVTWGAAVLTVTWRTRGIGDAVKVGAILGMVTIVGFHLFAIVRANVFLDAIRARDDWQHLLGRYHQSGFTSLRLYVNYEYLASMPMIVALGAIAGSISGVLGGVVNVVRRFND